MLYCPADHAYKILDNLEKFICNIIIEIYLYQYYITCYSKEIKYF